MINEKDMTLNITTEVIKMIHADARGTFRKRDIVPRHA